MATDWLDVSSKVPRISYTVGSTPQTAFNVPFLFFASDDLVVTVDGVLMTLGVHYTVSGAGNEKGGTVTSQSPLTNCKVSIVRQIVIGLDTHIPTYGPLDIGGINLQFSRFITILQELDNRTLQMPPNEGATLRTLASIANRRNRLLGFGTNGEIIYPMGPSFVSNTAIGVANVDSRATAETTSFDPGIDVISTAGVDFPGDGPTDTFRRLNSPPSPTKPWHMQTADGSWFAMAPAIQGSYARSFKAKGDGTTDDTVALQDAINWSIEQLQAGPEQVGANLDIYSGTLPVLQLGNGRYKITQPLKIGGYVRIEGQNAAIIQSDANADILDGLSTGPFTGVYRLYVRGVNFVGGRNQITLENDNIDSTTLTIENCEFHLSSDYAIKTAASGGNWHHLSATLSINDCHFSRVNKVLDNACDKATLTGGWIYVDKATVTPGTAIFRNRGETNGSHSPPRLHFDRVLMVPTMGVYGVDRVAGARWIDNYGVVTATKTRFGGEDAGMAIVNQLGAPATTDVYLSTAIILRDCDISAGPAADAGSGVVLLDGQVPNRISIHDCVGPSEVPFVVNLGGSVVMPTYFNNWESATGRKAFEGFSIDIDNNMSRATDGSIIDYGRVPSGMQRFVKQERMTQVSRSTTLNINTSGVNNFINFDTTDFDNFGAWSSGNSDRLTPQRGAARVRLTFTGVLSQNLNGKYISVSINNSAGTMIAKLSLPVGQNADGPGFVVTAETTYTPGEYYRANIRHDDSTVIVLQAGAKFSISPVNMVS